MTNDPEANILIVDDDRAVLDSLEAFVVRKGGKALLVASAEDALEALASNRIDIVLADIVLPGMDGLELTDRIKKDFDADIIVMTGYSEDFSYETAINKGASDFLFKPIMMEELELRINRVLRERRLRRERDAVVEKLKELSITDGLTGLYNSRHFYDQLKGEVNRSSRYHHPLSLLLMDIDEFKDYNDGFGHLEGDRVLAKMADIITSILRVMDTAYRYGGEEFTVILPDSTCEEAQTVAERIRKAIGAVSFHPEPDKAVRISISIGVTAYRPGEAIPDFVKRADSAMYMSKAAGRDRVTKIDP